MVLEQFSHIEALFNYLSIGIAVLDSSDLHVRFLNTYASTLIAEHGYIHDVQGRRIEELLPEEIHKNIVAILRSVATTGREYTNEELPFQGFEQTQGRTYWHVNIKKVNRLVNIHDALLVTIENATESVRSRLQLQAIQYVSSAIVGAYALPTVLDRILQVVSRLLGANASAILLIAHTISDFDGTRSGKSVNEQRMTLAAHAGIHSASQDWHPALDEHLLFAQVVQNRQTQTINDTSLYPEIHLPQIAYKGGPCQPGATLSMPIFEPYSSTARSVVALHSAVEEIASQSAIFGSIEVYYPFARNFPPTDIEMLEQLAQQAGLAIQNARFFRKLESLARAERRNAHQHKYMMQAMREGIIILDPRWRIAEANQTANTLFGWSDEVIGLPITEALQQSTAIFPHNTLHHELIADLERRANLGIIVEFKMSGADKKNYIIRSTYTPIQDEIGDTFAFLVVLHDVTELVKARQRIEAEVIERTKELAQQNVALQLAKAAQETEHAQLEFLLERLPSGVILVAQDSTIITINQCAIHFLQRLGISIESLDARDVRQARYLFHHIDVFDASGKLTSYEKRPLYQALKEGKTSEAELHMQDKDDETIYIFSSVAPLYDKDGIIGSAVFVFSDITAVKKLEQARDDFFTTMAHELKTPLANVRAQLTALLAKDVEWSQDDRYEALQVADEQVERLISVVQRSLEASRIETGALQPHYESIILPELFEDMEERLAALIASAKSSLRIKYPEALPAVHADYELIMSVLINLLSNAFRYAPGDDLVLVEAETMFAAQDSTQTRPIGVMIRVSDTGPGLTQEQQKLLFKRFGSLDTTHRGKGSNTTGLGLYISRGIVEAHGSKLTLVSSPGQGACFSFTLSTVDKTITI